MLVVGPGVPLVQVVPFDASTFPLVPGATKVGVDVPAPNITLLAVKVAAPVPPLATVITPVIFVLATDSIFALVTAPSTSVAVFTVPSEGARIDLDVPEQTSRTTPVGTLVSSVMVVPEIV